MYKGHTSSIYKYLLTHTHTNICEVNIKNWSLTQGSCRGCRLTVLLLYAFACLLCFAPPCLLSFSLTEREQQQQQPAFFAIIFYILIGCFLFTWRNNETELWKREPERKAEHRSVRRRRCVVVDCVRHVSHMCCCLCRAGCVERIVHGHS